MSTIVYLTSNCNMYCEYCYELSRRKELNGKVIETSLNNIYKLMNNNLYNKENDNCIVLFGGEPLLCIDKIQKIIQYNKEHCNNYYYFSMNTNGLLLNNNEIYKIISDYASSYRFKLEVSYDKSGQCRRMFNGSNSDELIKSVLFKLNKDKVPFYVGYTVHKGNYKNVINDVIYIFEKYNNINGIEVRFAITDIENLVNTNNFIHDTYRKLKYIYMKYGKSICTDCEDICKLCGKCNHYSKTYTYISDNLKRSKNSNDNDNLFSDF